MATNDACFLLTFALFVLLVPFLTLDQSSIPSVAAGRKLINAASPEAAGAEATWAPPAEPGCNFLGCGGQEGTALIPGLGRYASGELPRFPPAGSIFGRDTAGAIVGAHYIPGGDDTFVPNPGFEIPNPAAAIAGGIRPQVP